MYSSFASGQVAWVISAREECRFAGVGKRRKKEMGSLFRERKRHCRVHPCAHTGKASWKAFAKTEEVSA
jgi:hypothetical protein